MFVLPLETTKVLKNMRNVSIRIFADEINSNDEGCAMKRDMDKCGKFLIISWFKWQKDWIEKQTLIKLLNVIENKD